MLRLTTIFIIFGISSAFAQLRIGVVKVHELYKNDPLRIAYTEKSEALQAAILKNERRKNFDAQKQAFDNVEADMMRLRNTFDQLRSEAEKMDYQKKFNDLKELRSKRIAIMQSAYKELEEYISSETLQLNKETTKKQREVLDNIVSHVQKVAKQKDLDYVFEISGSTNTGITALPFVNPDEVIDITADVVVSLKGE